MHFYFSDFHNEFTIDSKRVPHAVYDICRALNSSHGKHTRSTHQHRIEREAVKNGVESFVCISMANPGIACAPFSR